MRCRRSLPDMRKRDFHFRRFDISQKMSIALTIPSLLLARHYGEHVRGRDFRAQHGERVRHRRGGSGKHYGKEVAAARNTATFAVRPVRYTVIRSPLIDDVIVREAMGCERAQSPTGRSVFIEPHIAGGVQDRTGKPCARAQKGVTFSTAAERDGRTASVRLTDDGLGRRCARWVSPCR